VARPVPPDEPRSAGAQVSGEETTVTDESTELTERERVALGLPPAPKVERDEDGALSAAELARRILERS